MEEQVILTKKKYNELMKKAHPNYQGEFSTELILKLCNDGLKQLQSIVQWWKMYDFEYINKYMNVFQHIVEELEGNYCGSIGGFGGFQNEKRISPIQLFDRYYFLITKAYKIENEVKGAYGFTLNKAHNFFTTLPKY
jgi:hypothetical protein